MNEKSQQLGERIISAIEKSGVQDVIERIRGEREFSSNFWERARVRNQIEKDRQLKNNQQLAGLIVDELERRGLTCVASK